MFGGLPVLLSSTVARCPAHPKGAPAMARPTQRSAHPPSRFEFVAHTLRQLSMHARSAARAKYQVHFPRVVRAHRGYNPVRGPPRTVLYTNTSHCSIATISAPYQLRRVQDEALNPRVDSVRCRTGRVLRSSCKSSTISQGTNTAKLVIILHAASS